MRASVNKNPDLQCTVSSFRPISHSDFQYFRIPPLPASATGWVLLDPMPVGFCAFDPVPGLPDIADVYLYVLSSNRGNGAGSRLLAHVSQEAKAAGVTRLSTIVDDPKGWFATYLRARGFYEEHVEIDMVCQVPSWTRPALHELVELPNADAAYLMQQLYDECFRGTAWYQPYTDVSEIADSIAGGDEVLFMFEQGTPVGFAAVSYANSTVEVEPFGIVKAQQGQGFGRKLMQSLMHRMHRKNIREVRLSVWASNLPALALYGSFGFEGVNTRTFFEKSLL